MGFKFQQLVAEMRDQLVWLQLRDLFLFFETQKAPCFLSLFSVSTILYTLLTSKTQNPYQSNTIAVAVVTLPIESLSVPNLTDLTADPVPVAVDLIHWIRDAGGCFRRLLLEPPRRCSHQPPLSWRCWVINLCLFPICWDIITNSEMGYTHMSSYYCIWVYLFVLKCIWVCDKASKFNGTWCLCLSREYTEFKLGSNVGKCHLLWIFCTQYLCS